MAAICEPAVCRFSRAIPGVILVLTGGSGTPDVAASPEEALAMVQAWSRRRCARRNLTHVAMITWENCPEGFQPPQPHSERPS